MLTTSVANWFIGRALQENQPLSPLQVQKLMYLAESAYGATFHQNLTPADSFKAWEHGPVDTTVYHSLKRYGRDTVTAPIFCSVNEEISEEAGDIFETVWEYFGHLSASTLRNLTHDVGPWAEYYDPMAPNRRIPSAQIYECWNNFLDASVAISRNVGNRHEMVTGRADELGSYILDLDAFNADKEWISALNGGVLKTS